MGGDGLLVWLFLCAAALGFGLWAGAHLTWLAILVLCIVAALIWAAGAAQMELEGFVLIIPSFLWFVGLAISVLASLNWSHIWAVVGPYIVR